MSLAQASVVEGATLQRFHRKDLGERKGRYVFGIYF